MPCRDDRGSCRTVTIENTDKIDALEILLCSACRTLDLNKFDFGTNPTLDEWWDKHKKADLKREERDAKKDFRRRQAIDLSKKTVAELSNGDLTILREFGYIK